jgi:hypothetical protein
MTVDRGETVRRTIRKRKMCVCVVLGRAAVNKRMNELIHVDDTKFSCGNIMQARDITESILE